MITSLLFGLMITVNMGLDTFSEKFQDQNIQILSMKVNEQIRNRFNNIIWQENQYNKIRFKNLSYNFWVLNHDLQQVKCFQQPIGFYSFNGNGLNLFLYDYNSNPIHLSLNGDNQDNIKFNHPLIFINKQEKFLYLVIKKHREGFLHPMNYYGLKFISSNTNQCHFIFHSREHNPLYLYFLLGLLVVFPWFFQGLSWIINYLWQILQLFFHD